jgi:hypothetical protein
MSKLVIKDLPESLELDRAAMAAIVGGARRGGSFLAAAAQPDDATRAASAILRVIDYPAGFAAPPRAERNAHIPARSLLRG